MFIRKECINILKESWVSRSGGRYISHTEWVNSNVRGLCLCRMLSCRGLSTVYCQFGKYCHYLSWHLCKHRTLHGTCSNFSGRGLWGKIVLSEPKPALPPRVSLAFSPTKTSVLGSADTYQYHKPDALLPTVCLQNFQWETWAGIQGQNPWIWIDRNRRK